MEKEVIPLKLGIIYPPHEDSFEKAAGLGLEFVEFCINIGNDVDKFLADLPKLKDASIKTGVAVGSIGRWGSDRIGNDGQIIEEELLRSYQLIDAASYLQCPNFVCGCNYVEGLSYYANCSSAIAYFSKLLEYGKAKNVAISTYNCHWNSFVDNEQAWNMIHGHLPELGIKFDPSHSRYAGRDYLLEAVNWGHRFKHVHIKGSVIVGGNRVDDPPAGLDQTDWGTFMSILYEKEYDCGLSIEPHSKIWTGNLGDEGVRFTVHYMRKFLF
jgi:sugar phosphate isomerase/epimerase